jgi:hypothetical protein
LWIALSQGNTGGDQVKDRYKVHRFEVTTKSTQSKLEQFLNGLKGEIVTIIPCTSPEFTLEGMNSKVDCLLIVEKIK